MHDTVDRYFGQEIHDPYRYMEESTPEAMEWIREQGEYSERLLGAFPERNQLRDRLRTLDEHMAARFQFVTRMPRERYLYSKSSPNDDTYKLYVSRGLGGEERLLVDPVRYREPGGPPASLELVYPSPDGTLVAYAISIGNSERAAMHVMNTDTGKDIEKPIANVLRFSWVNWSHDGRSIFYNRMPSLEAGALPTERYLNTAVYRHVLGSDASTDRIMIGPGKEAALKTEATQWASLHLPLASRWALAVISNGVGNERALYVATQKEIENGTAKWRKIVDFTDQVTDLAVHGDELYLITQKGAPRGKVVRTRLPGAELDNASAVIPESVAAPISVGAARDALYVAVREGPAGRLLRVPYTTGKPEPLALPMDGIPEPYAPDPRLDGTLFTVHGWTRGPGIFAYHAPAVHDTKLRPESAAERNADLQVTHESVTASDGVAVPLTIVHKRGVERSADNMTYLVGYGSYGSTMDPFFDAFVLAWYQMGGTLAVAHVRGGGEFGEEWHNAGKKATKGNTWRDFIACAEFLVREKHTRPERLVGAGVSAGGILIGRAITERPDLFGAALIGAGTMDMLRGEFQKNGPVNVPEFGTVKNAEDFPALVEMSAYHHVKDEARYPAVLLTTGMNDPVVDPWQPAKMAARLQSSTSSGKPVLLRVDNAGHDQWGSTRSELYALRADQLVFMLWQVGALSPRRQ